MLVEEVMTSDLVGCEADATLETVAAQMLEHRVGSVLVYRADDPAGIVTETDLIRAGYRTERPFDDVVVEDVMSRPLVTVADDATLRKAAARMESEHVKKLPVLDGLTVVGIVTMTDIAYHLSDVKRQVHRMEQRATREWDS